MLHNHDYLCADYTVQTVMLYGQAVSCREHEVPVTVSCLCVDQCLCVHTTQHMQVCKSDTQSQGWFQIRICATSISSYMRVASAQTVITKCTPNGTTSGIHPAAPGLC